MNILMMTNTYTPHVSGVAYSVSAFTKELRNLGHQVVVVAPEYKEDMEDEQDVIRIPAIQHFNGSDFSVVLPVPVFLENHLEDFRPHVVHSHHPFLTGSTAVRVSKKYNVPLVYTQHTMFEEYTHYVPVGFTGLKKFVVSLSTGYSNMSDHVFAPSESIAKVLRGRGVKVPIEIIPTGVDIDSFANGDGGAFRHSHEIPKDAFVVGHLGRLAPEKNLGFLSKAVASFLQNEPKAHFIIVGYGPSKQELSEFFIRNNLQQRVHPIGRLHGRELVDAYHAMDVFVFSSRSETQGLVLVEAMASGVPVVALDAPGVREVTRDGINGYLLYKEKEETFAHALRRIFHMPDEDRKKFSIEAKRTAAFYSMQKCVFKLLSVYESLLENKRALYVKDERLWQRSIEQLKTEWELFSNLTSAVGDAL